MEIISPKKKKRNHVHQIRIVHFRKNSAEEMEFVLNAREIDIVHLRKNSAEKMDFVFNAKKIGIVLQINYALR